MKKVFPVAAFLLAGLLVSAGPASVALAPAHQSWLEEVTPIITKTERDVFLKLRTDAERDKFIRFFWRQRDPLPDTSENEFTKEYMERVRFADQYFGIGSARRGCQTERGFYYLLLGKPLERNVYATYSEFWPLELWYYKGEEAYGLPPYFYLIFYQPEGIGDYRLYYPGIEGPEKLVIPNAGTRTNNRKAAAEILRKSNAELASASMSYLPGDRGFGSGSFSSDNIIAAAKALPEKKYNDAYARGYLTYKDYVETDYADNYIGAGAKVRLFRAAGQPFLHWTIEPDRMSFAQRGDAYFAGFELVVRMEDLQGKVILERTEEIPVRLTPEQYKANERRRFAFQDLLPLTPGDRRLFFLFKNKTSREFTSFETTVSVPRPDGGPALSSLLLLHGRDRLPEGQRASLKAFTFDGVQCVVSAKNEFLPAESLEAFVQVSAPKEAAADTGASLVFAVAALDGGAVVVERKVSLAEAAAGHGRRRLFRPVPPRRRQARILSSRRFSHHRGQNGPLREGELHRPGDVLSGASPGLCQAPRPLPLRRASGPPRFPALPVRGICRRAGAFPALPGDEGRPGREALSGQVPVRPGPVPGVHRRAPPRIRGLSRPGDGQGHRPGPRRAQGLGGRPRLPE